jgi:ThiF family
MTDTHFSYEEMTTRNIGFVSPQEQASLRNASVFIPGVGGMGGAALMALVRAGVGHFTIADLDGYEVSNLNRQLFATMDSIGTHKATAAAQQAKRINPDVKITVLGKEWTDQLPEIAQNHHVIVNGMDDLAAGVYLYRCARQYGRTLIDAYASPLPSVTVVRPNDPRLEERLGYPTLGVDWTAITQQMRNTCFVKEIEYVLTHSSSHKYIDLEIAGDVAAGRRSRFSFSTMVTLAGTMMAQEAIHQLLARKAGTDYRGYFFNPHAVKVERPIPAIIAVPKGFLVRKFLKKMMT